MSLEEKKKKTTKKQKKGEGKSQTNLGYINAKWDPFEKAFGCLHQPVVHTLEHFKVVCVSEMVLRKRRKKKENKTKTKQ